ncbi:MAG: heme-binding protein [Pseudomonadota bacterium]
MKRMILVIAGVLAALAFASAASFIYVTSNVETPKYTVVERDGDIEIRDYPSLRVAEIDRAGSRNGSANAAFRPLASYIFARKRDGEKISMTAPVTQQDNGGSWTVQFIMPAQYSLADLPKPDNGEIRLRELPAQRRVAIRFSGRATDALFDMKEDELKKWLQKRGLSVSGKPTYAYYNDPFTPGFLRRNEVLFDL